MTKPFSGLKKSQRERLDMLSEEAGEIVQAIGKIGRHGYDSYNPDATNNNDNRDDLEHEIADLLGIVDKMNELGDINITRVNNLRLGVWDRKLQYTHHQKGSPK